MEFENDYREQVGALVSSALRNEAIYMENKTDEEKKLMPTSTKIPDCNYRAMGWNTGSHWFSICPRCERDQVNSHSIRAGCRFNGDAYGSDFNICQHCGFLKWSSWDEH